MIEEEKEDEKNLFLLSSLSLSLLLLSNEQIIHYNA